MSTWVNILINAVIYMLFLSGIVCWYGRAAIAFYRECVMRKRLWERARRAEKRTFGYSRIYRHLDYIGSVGWGIKGVHLILVTLISFLSMFIITRLSLNMRGAYLSSILFAMLPYMLARMKFERMRRKSSFEGEKLISSFLHSYRISNFNVYEGLEGIIGENNGKLKSNGFILKMLLELRKSGSPEEIRRIVGTFGEMVNTNWSRMFAYNVQIAAEKGINISLAVEDILIQLRDARYLYEERKRLNSEAMRIVVYMIPLLYVLTVIGAIGFIGIKPMKLIQNQFFTQEGFTLLNISLLLFFINVILMECVSNRRFDY